MPTFERPWGYWQRMIDELRASPLPYMRQESVALQAKLDETPADQELVRISFSEESYYRSIFGASLAMGEKLLEP